MSEYIKVKKRYQHLRQLTVKAWREENDTVRFMNLNVKLIEREDREKQRALEEFKRKNKI